MGRQSIQGDSKLCTGPLHREGVMIPLSQYFYHGAGHMKGKPFSECKRCWRATTGRDPDNGEAVAERLGRDRTVFSRGFRRMRAPLYRDMKVLLDEIDEYGRGTTNPEVVLGKKLAVVLQDYCVRWFRERPSGNFGVDEERRNNGGSTFIGPVQYLAQETGISIRRVSGMCNGEYEYVDAYRADRVLTAIGLSHMLSNGEIPVVPNPTWSMERYLAYMEKRGCI
jgi:hypothetical protein